MAKKIVITGASGNLGRRLRAGLQPRTDLELVLLDRDPRGEPDVVAADLSCYDKIWAQRFNGAEAVVHLAANPSPQVPWDELECDNVDAVLNVFEAAVAGGVARVVFASTINVMQGHSVSDVTITTELPPKPMTAYAFSKLAGERIGKSFSSRHRLSVVCIRIGAIPPNENLPTPAWPVWHQITWLSERDFCQGLEKAIEAEAVHFSVLNLVSDNAGSPIDLSESSRVIGYRAQDGWTPPPLTFTVAMRNTIVRKKPGLARWLRRQ